MSLAHVVFVAEATPRYAAMLRLAAWGLRRNGGALAALPATVVYNERGDEATMAYLRERHGIQSAVLPRLSTCLKFTNKWNCLRLPGLEASTWLIHLDCDTVIVRDMGPLLEQLRTTRADIVIAPEHVQQARRMGTILAEATGRREREIEHLRHPWFPSEGWPLFNIGVFALRTRHARAVFEHLPALVDRVYEMEQRTWRRPLERLRIGHNRRMFARGRWDRMIGPHFPRPHTNQIAFPAMMINLGLKYEWLAPSMHYRVPDHGHGVETPIRLVHYMGGTVRPLDRDHLLSRQNVETLRSGTNPAWHELAEALEAYLREEAPGAARGL